MSTLAEIEAATASLPPGEQQSLLFWLKARVDAPNPQPAAACSLDADAAERLRQMKAWLARMREIGEQIEAESVTDKTLVELVREGRD